MKKRNEGGLLPPTGPAVEKLSWEDTAREMAASHEDWSAWDSAIADGLDDSLTNYRPGCTKPLEEGGRRRLKRKHQDLHLLDEDGMVACNPRDREAAHRAAMEGIATQNPNAVTCGKCRAAMRKQGRRTRPPVSE